MTKPRETRGAFAALDQVLRGELTRPSTFLHQGTAAIPAGSLALVCLLLAAVSGLAMGSYAVSHEGGNGFLQMVASAVKVPALFGLTLLVTFPSLYVSNALVGSRLGPKALLTLLVASIAVTLAVLASLSPIVAFFSVITVSYAFVLVMNVVAFGVSGLLGLGFLLQTLHRITLAEQARARHQQRAPVPLDPPSIVEGKEDEIVDLEPSEERGTSENRPLGALDQADERVPSGQVKLIFRVWVILFGLVGVQMSWVLRPFIGAPNLPFTWFRPRQSNFFEAVFQAIVQLFQG